MLQSSLRLIFSTPFILIWIPHVPRNRLISQFSQPVDGNTSFRQIRTAIVRW